MIHIKKHMSVCIALAVLLAVPPVYASSDNTEKPKQRISVGDPFAGKKKSQVCHGCHGADGNSTNESIPKLAGQYEGYISKQMRNYLAGTRSHELMNGMAAPLSDKDLDDISAYYANQPRMKGAGSTANQQGKKIFLKGNIEKMVMTCVYCHGGGGKGLEPDIAMYPVIGGQHKAYLVKTLRDFRGDDRVNGPNSIMNKIVRSLSDEEIEAVSEYISSL